MSYRHILSMFWLTIAVFLAACTAPASQSAQPAAPSDPTESPWQPGTPQPLFAPLNAECYGQRAPVPGSAEMQYGANVFLFATDRARVLSLTNIAGFTWMRQQIHWRDLEGEPGQFIWKPLDQIVSAARSRDLQIMVSVVRSPEWATAESGGHDGLPDDPATLARFLSEVATRYRGRVAAYQVWNEPNLAHEGGGSPATPAQYLATLQAAYAAIKAADPCALVVSAALAATHNPDPTVAREDLPFFRELYEREDGAFLQAADVVGAHTGAGSNPPHARWSPSESDMSHQYFRHIERTHAIMEEYNDPRQVWLTEFGWTVTAAEGAPLPVTLEQQATYLVDALWYARHYYPWMGAMFVWNINFSIIAPPDDEKTTFSVLGPDWAIRPAFIALQNNVNALRDVNRAPLVPDAVPYRYQWTFPGRGALRLAPLVGDDGTVYAVSDPGTIYAIGPDGWLRWHFFAPGSITTAPARAPDGTLFVTDSGSMLSAVRPDGSLDWQVQLDDLSRHSPVYLDEQVIIVNLLGEIVAFDMDGVEQWRYDLAAESTPLAVSSDDALLVVDAEGELAKVSSSGDLIWSTGYVGEFWSAPVPAPDGGLYLVTVNGTLRALDSAGTLRWSTTLATPVEAAPLLGNDGALYVAARNGVLSKIDTTDGTLMWQYEAESDLLAPPARGADGTLYQGTANELLLAINADGTLRWQIQVRGPIHAAPAVTPDDSTLYVPTMGGRLYSFAR